MSDEAIQMGSGGVICHGGVDIQRESEGGAAFLASDAWLPAGAHAFEE